MDLNYFLQSGCCNCDTRKKLVLSEHKCSITFMNNSKQKICKIRIDNCLIKKGLKCDYLVLYPEGTSAFFIELKGQDLLHAISQISNTIDQLIHQLEGSNINVRIVLTKVNTPDLMNNPVILKFEKKIKKFNGTFKKGTIRLIEQL